MSLIHAIAPPVEIEFDGERLFLPPLTLTHLGTIIDYMRGKLVDNVPAAIAAAKEVGGDAATTVLVIREALKERREAQDISIEQAIGFISTVDGVSLALFLLLDQQYPGKFTRDGVLRSILKLSGNKSALQRLFAKLATASGMDGGGNSTPAGETETANPAGANEPSKASNSNSSNLSEPTGSKS